MSTDQDFSASRRAFLKFSSKPEPREIRPPWSDEASVSAGCTGCGACVEACPQSILFADADGRPFVRFDGGECTFCEKCVQACDEPVFDLRRKQPFEARARIESACLQFHGISCQSCRDHCPNGAIRIDLASKPFGQLRVDEEICTGCGACLSTCPQEAIALKVPSKEMESA